MHDAVMLEARGVPSAAIVTTEFVLEAETQRDALGMAALSPVVIAHPLSTLTEAEIGERIDQALPQIERVWLGRDPAAA
jgi:hypothetical protein